MRVKALVLAALLATAVGTPASAQDAGVLRCNATVRPGGWTSGYCLGTLTGTVNGTLSIAWDFNSLGCPALASATGTMTVNGNLWANVAFQQVGAHFDMVLTGNHLGVVTGVVVTTPLDPLCVLPETIVSLVGTFVAV